MSIIVGNKPIGMWSNDELRECLDRMVCTEQTTPNMAVLAEGVSRLLSAHPRMNRRAEDPNNGAH